MTVSPGRRRQSLRRQILVRGSAGVLLAATGLAVLLGLSARMRSQLFAASDAFVEEQMIANRINQAVMRQFLVVSSVRGRGMRDGQQDFQAVGNLVSEQLRLYLFRSLTAAQRLQLERINEEHQRLEVAAARAAELFGRGDGAAGEEAFAEMSVHGFALLGALDAFLQLRETDLRGLRRTQQNAFRVMHAAGWVFGAVLLVASVVLLRFLLGRVDAPLSQLTAAARRMAHGELDARVPEAYDEEFATVAASFNRMAEQTADAQRRLEQQVAERTAALQASEEQFRTLATTAHDAIIAADVDGCITYFNPAAERTFGYAAAEVLGGLLTVLMPERFHEPHQQGLARYVATGEARVVGRTVELAGRRKDGTEFPLELSLASRRHNGAPAFIGIIRDITERKETEQALRHNAAKLEAANAELEAFSYSVSHDLRAPLRSIHGFSQAVLEDYREQLNTEGTDYLRRVCAAAEQMGMLIDDLLELSRATRAEMERERVDLSQLGERIARELAVVDPERDVDFRIGGGLTCEGDRELLALVLRNLLENAWKFTAKESGAVIEVGVTDEEERTFFVRDNGAGFDMTYADKLFHPFQRLHSPRDFPGTGIGLALVQRIIHRHGGRVWAEGTVGDGATFYFTLSDA